MLLLLVFVVFVVLGLAMPPLSLQDPVADLGFKSVQRTGVSDTPSNQLWKEWNSDALPTNEFWTNAVLASGVSLSNNFMQSPYVVQPLDSALLVTIPWPVAVSVYDFQNMYDFTVMSLQLSAAECNGSHSVTDSSPMSVDMKWNCQKGSFSTPLVRGNPYISMSYENAKPLISSPQDIRSVKVDGNPLKLGSNNSFTATRVSVSFIQSDSTWNIYFSSPLSLELLNQPSMFTLQSAEEWNGSVRIAIVNNCTTGSNSNFCKNNPQGIDSTEYESYLNSYSNVWVRSVQVSYKTSQIENTTNVIVNYLWQYSPFYKNTFLTQADVPLMFAFPHHSEMLKKTSSVYEVPGMHFYSIKGKQTLFRGYQWSLEYSLPTLSFESLNPIHEDKVEVLKEYLAKEVLTLPVNLNKGASDPYNAGKMFARFAKLALIARQLEDMETAQKIISTIRDPLTLWLTQASANPLLFDDTWKGIVSCGCDYDDCNGNCEPRCMNTLNGQMSCPALQNYFVDFGNAFYNDHHFHYGYFILSAAVIGQFDSEWLQINMENVLLMVRDIANPSDQDEFFPKYRMMDWYAGHSWALGIPLAGSISFQNGKNQESSSEAVNAWYGIYLLGLSSNKTDVRDLGLAHLATEMYTAQHYWQVQNDSIVYPEVYWPNHVMGIVWSHLAQFSTYFSSKRWAVHGIETLPFTPASEVSLSLEWVKQSHQGFQNDCLADPECVSDGWSPFVFMEQSMLDSSAAWQNALSVDPHAFEFSTPGGNGNSFTNMLYYISTRPLATFQSEDLSAIQ